MSASGKSSNRRSEYNRGRNHGTGHGIYAEQGKRDREAAQEAARRRQEADRSTDPPQ